MRQEILHTVITALSRISRDTGYNTDYGSTVVEWKVYSDPSNVSQMQVRDTSCVLVEEAEGNDNTEKMWVKELTLDVDILANSKDAVKTLRSAIQDVLHAFNVISWPEGVTNCEWVSDVLISDESNRIYAGIAITFKITYRTPAWTD